jgi:hypothetical protein
VTSAKSVGLDGSRGQAFGRLPPTTGARLLLAFRDVIEHAVALARADRSGAKSAGSPTLRPPTPPERLGALLRSREEMAGSARSTQLLAVTPTPVDVLHLWRRRR